MKYPFSRLFPLILIAPLCAGCRKAPAAPAATTAGAAAVSTPAGGQPGQSVQQGQPGQPPASPVPAKPVPATLPNVLAKVNGEAVERWELETALKRAEARAGSPVPAEQRDEVLRNMLDQIVAFHLLSQESHARRLEATDTEVDAQLAKIRQSFPTEEAFNQGLAIQGLTMDLLKRQTRMTLGVQKLVELEVDSKITVSDADVDGFYKQNLERFKQGESVRASHILIGVPQNADEAQKKTAKDKAQQILKQARGGSDFATLAKEQSQDPGSAPNGGDLGFFPKGQMTPTFDEAAFTLKPGALSGVVESPFGFHIIKVHERRPARTIPLAEVTSQIREFLTQGQRQTKLDQFIEQSKAKTKIEILV